MSNEARINSDEDDHESAHWFVCSRAEGSPARFHDDLYDFCSECGEKVRYRPYGPVAPKKICFECAIPSMKEAIKDGKLEIVSSTKSADEFERVTGQTLDISSIFDKINEQ